MPTDILASFEYLSFLNFLGIGLSILLPKGLFCLFIKQAEFVLKKKLDPSLLVCFLLVFNTTALYTSPFFTLDPCFNLLRNSLTETITKSPS